jgi:hypothetical protein
VSLRAAALASCTQSGNNGSARIVVSASRLMGQRKTASSSLSPTVQCMYSLFQDCCLKNVYREAQTSQLRSLTLSFLYLASDERARMHRHVALAWWPSSPYATPSQSSQSKIGSGPRFGIAPNETYDRPLGSQLSFLKAHWCR